MPFDVPFEGFVPELCPAGVRADPREAPARLFRARGGTENGRNPPDTPMRIGTDG